MKKVFVICPVRGATPEVKKKLENYIEELEKMGYEVHYPPRNTNQSDVIGNQICEQNFKAMLESQEIHRWYDDESSGGHFDFGGTFMLYLLKKLVDEMGKDKVLRLIKQRRKIVFINRGEIPYKPGKSFQKVLTFLEKQTQERKGR